MSLFLSYSVSTLSLSYLFLQFFSSLNLAMSGNNCVNLHSYKQEVWNRLMRQWKRYHKSSDPVMRNSVNMNILIFLY